MPQLKKKNKQTNKHTHDKTTNSQRRKKTKCTHGWVSKIKDHTATKPAALKGWPRENPWEKGPGVDKQTVSHMEHTQGQAPGPDQDHTAPTHRRGGMGFWAGGWGGGETTHRGCGQGRLSNQVGVRNGHAQAQPRARLLHGRHRRLEVAGERGGGGGRGRGGVGGLRRKRGGGRRR